jgi:hypothetical protein
MIKMDVHVCGTYIDGRLYHGTGYTVEFSTEAQAVTFAQRKRSTCVVSEREDSPLDGFTDLLMELYPTCHHGMDAQMCMDPVGDNHWGTCEQELMGVI